MQNMGINCNDFMRAQDVIMREGTRRAANPLRKYMFFTSEVREGSKYLANMINFGRIIVNHCRAKHQEQMNDIKDGKTRSDGRSDGGGGPNTIIYHLLEHDYPTEEHRISDVIVFLIAGHETTAHTLSFLLYLMASNEDAQIKVHKNLGAITPTGNDISLDLASSSKGEADSRQASFTSKYGKILTLNDLSSAPSLSEYFNWCFKESQRLFPVAPVVSRVASEDIHYNGMVIPKDSIVFGGCSYLDT